MLIVTTRQKLEAEISKRTAEACDQIISEMGAEIHDDLIQKLSVFRLYIDRLERASGDEQEVESLILKMKADFEQVSHVIRSISRRLMPVRIEGDTLVDMLKRLCENIEQPGTGHIHLENKGKAKALEFQKEMYLLRIVQELIQNAFRHSSAWHVWVRLTWKDKKLFIEVEDDGSGFSRIPEFIARLKKKNNTLKMRSNVIGASLDYLQGQKGLLAKLQISTND